MLKRGYLKNYTFLNSYKPGHPDVKNLRILLHGPVGAGKSSFINSVQSALRDRVAISAQTDATSGSSFTRKVWKLCKLFVDSKEQLKQIHTAIDLLSFVGQCRHHSARTKEFRADDVHVNLPKSFKKWWITYPWKQHKINLTCVHICINRNTLLYREIEIEEYTYFPLKPSLVNPWLFRCCSKYTFILLPCW